MSSRLFRRDLHVDSRDRDLAKWSSESEYRVWLQNPLRHVVGFRVVHVDLPTTAQFTVNAYNKKLDITYNSVEYNLTFTEGDYTRATFLDHLKSTLDTATSITWTVTNDVFNHQFTISNTTAAFSFDVKTGANADTVVYDTNGNISNMTHHASARDLLGLSWTDHSSTGSSPFSLTIDRKDHKENETVFLSLEANQNVGTEIETPLTASNIVLTLPIRRDKRAVYTDKQSLNLFLPEPIRRLQYFDVKWKDRYGNLIDFNGMHHHFTLRLLYAE